MPQILVFGDSIAYGAWDKEGGWVERLKVFTNRKAISSGLEFYCAVYNLAIDGDYTRTLLKRLESETKQRADVGQETIFVFAIGKNDAISNKKSVFWT
ncbi:SGNH/GDSL hydrolase family protein, partial [Patescibacteria group bacterium]|nr:SGNH/GDSL hydrolase family protein [Patescibacteria group bacterium]